MTKVALVTGGSRGIGKGIVKSLVQDGWKVAFCGRNETTKEIPENTKYFQCDIADSASRKKLLQQTLDKFGRLDLLVNNAGVAPEKRLDLLEMSEASFDRVMNINLKGPFFLSQLVGQYMSEEKISGTIINIGSISATVASISRGEYCISKAGIAMMTQLFAVRMAECGVNVYEIRPGLIQSDMTSVVKERYDKLIAEGLTLQERWGMPEDVGKAVASLARGDFAYSTGQVIKVDGGMEIGRL